MRAVFALLPTAADFDALVPGADAMHTALRLRRYPRASDGAHLLSLVRDGRDPIATRWVRGLVLAIAAGGVLGALTMGSLAYFFHMLGGLLGLAVPLGFCIGMFLGGFTAAMTGTQVARDEVKRLADAVQAGDQLVQWTGDPGALLAVAERCRAAGLRTAAVD